MISLKVSGAGGHLGLFGPVGIILFFFFFCFSLSRWIFCLEKNPSSSEYIWQWIFIYFFIISL